MKTIQELKDFLDNHDHAEHCAFWSQDGTEETCNCGLKEARAMVTATYMSMGSWDFAVLAADLGTVLAAAPTPVTGEGEWPDDATIKRAMLAYATICKRDGQDEDHYPDAIRAALQAAASTPATGGGEWPDDATIARACSAYSIALGQYGSRLQRQSAHEYAMRAALAAAPTPAEPTDPDDMEHDWSNIRRGAINPKTPAEPTNPGEISSKLVEPLRDEVEDLAERLSRYGGQWDSQVEWSGDDMESLLLDAGTAADLLRARRSAEPLRDAGAVDGPPALIALWRQREPDNGEEFTEFDKGYEQASEECADSLERWWRAHPAPQQPAITDAMVERACETYHGPVAWRVHVHQGTAPNKRVDMRRALTAAQEKARG